ncbi:MAG: hypothetical protein C5S47_06485 [Candidatus Methanogasteraceae archaeon]|nr:MAG: hypothetical protein C5S47_06485 [ANME-2 cluster archaeon]
MMDFKVEIIKQLEVLPYDWQCHVLDFTRTLVNTVQVGSSGSQLLRFAGTIRADDLQVMERAIEDYCERIDINDW